LLTVLPLAQALALEAATTGTQATQAVVGAINSKVDTSIAALQAQITGIVYCNSIRKFYAPGDAKKDSNSCVGTGDYDLNMASGSNVKLADGQVVGTQGANDSNGVLINANGSNSNGIYGAASGGGSSGVRGSSSSYWGGAFQGASGVYGFGNNGYDLQAGSANSWAGIDSHISEDYVTHSMNRIVGLKRAPEGGLCGLPEGLRVRLFGAPCSSADDKS
jgi:hypothetical protein